ncbi:hypothetical protein [Acerihabitans sp.]|uniref:HoxN/HupN/NixA family nickel/cobalt transporter n=1 Tax=Acerihabitans sp. TaxID=2811394 RepID=UPI002ED7E1D2
MTELNLQLSSLLIMFALGLRHGLDPDHIACIDGLTWHSIKHKHAHAKWVGTLFAIGHGGLVTGIAIFVSYFTQTFTLPPAVRFSLDWLPTLMLLAIGVTNLWTLMNSAHYRPVGWKMKLFPTRLLKQSNPLSIILVGVIFAAVFDTATQAAAWGYVASNTSQHWQTVYAAVMGCVFTTGMMITDTLDGRIVNRLSRQTESMQTKTVWRNSLGYLIVFMSFFVAVYNITVEFNPGIAFNELVFTMIGAGFVILMLLFLVFHYFRNKKYGHKKSMDTLA